MKKDINDTLLPITQEEFINITNLLFSKDKECRILGVECLRPFVSKIYDGFDTHIWLTDEFWITPVFSGWFRLSTGGMAGPKVIYKTWENLKNCQK